MALPDYLASNLKVVFVGTSVATASASRGHYYSGPGNKFWELLWFSGLTGDRKLIPEQDSTVDDYGIGLTDLVKRRAASSDSLLRPSDYDVPAFVEKMKRLAPKCVAFNGRKAGETVGKHLEHPVLELGLQPWLVESSRVWVLPSSSGAVHLRLILRPGPQRLSGGQS